MKRRMRLAGAALALALGLAGLAGCGGSGAKAKPKADLGSGQGAAVLAAGDAALAHGEPQEAGRLYLEALGAGAAPALVHTRMGDLYLGMGMDNLPKAAMAYREALKSDPKCAPAMQGLGFAIYLSGNKAEASLALAKALELDPRLPRAAALLGTIEAREGRPEAALAVYDRSLAVAFDPDVENNRGLALLMLGRSEEAVAAFRKAGTAKKSPKIANNLGLALCRLGRYDEAYTTFAGAASEATALNNLGVCYMEAGNKAKAQEYFERAIAANPRFYAVAQENLSRLSAAEEVSLPSAVAAAAPSSPATPPPAATPKPLAPASTGAPAAAVPTPATPKPLAPAPAQPAAPSASQPAVQPAAKAARPLQESPAKGQAPAASGKPSAVERLDRSEMP